MADFIQYHTRYVAGDRARAALHEARDGGAR
jgi:hypothetical protein